MTYARNRAAKPARPAKAKLLERVEAAPVNFGVLGVVALPTGTGTGDTVPTGVAGFEIETKGVVDGGQALTVTVTTLGTETGGV
jgi:hypothetical protein